jgi:hypothetical protein
MHERAKKKILLVEEENVLDHFYFTQTPWAAWVALHHQHLQLFFYRRIQPVQPINY